jgi:signal peptidase I
VAEGNQKLLYKTPEAGTIFVYEDPGNRLIYRSAVKRGDTIELNTNDDRISINGKTVMEKGLGSGHNYKMFFDPAGSRKVVTERRTETISR